MFSSSETMLNIKLAQLAIVLVLLVSSEGSLPKKISGKKRKHSKIPSSDEDVTRSALVGINPDDLTTTSTADTSTSSRNDVDPLDKLPDLKDEQKLTEKALEYSRLLSPVDQRLVKEFDKVTTSSGNVAPASSKPKMEEINVSSASPELKTTSNVSRYNRALQLTDPVVGDGLGRTDEFNPLRDPDKEEFSTPRSADLDKDIFRQISQMEGESSSENDKNGGHITDIYKDNPLPEYNYKESEDQAQVSEYHPEEDYTKFYKENPFEMPKTYDQPDPELIEGYRKLPKENIDNSDSNSEFFTVIGKKVLLNLLENQNRSQSQADQALNQDFLKKLIGLPAYHKDGNSEQLPTKKVTPTSPIAKRPTNADISQIVSTSQTTTTNGKISNFAQQAIPTTPQILQRLNLPPGIKLEIMGQLSKNDPLASRQENKAPAKEVTSSKAAVFPTEKQASSIEIQSDSKAANNILSKDGRTGKENLVTLKISRGGKPISFKADTSNDGSLVLKIPGNVTFMNTAGKKDTQEAIPADKSKPLDSRLYQQTGQLDNLRFDTNVPDLQDFSKKQEMVSNNVDNIEGLSGWQILGKTNPSLGQEEFKDQAKVHNFVQSADKFPSTGQPTQGQFGHALSEGPTARQEWNQEPTAKSNDLSSVSFAGVGQSPPSGLFPPSFRLRQTLPLRQVLRPSKFIEDAADVRTKLRFGSMYTSERKFHHKTRNMWSPCSVTCGQGIQARARLCEGVQCRGYRTESKTCFRESCPEQLGRAGLRLHNKFRAWHQSPPLKWSERLAEKAQKMAIDMASRKSIRLSDMKESSGVNIAQLWHSYDIAAEKATADWYSEVKSFNFDDPKIEDSTKHFTQLVWKDSKQVGIGAAKSRDGEYTFVVALYDPPGNIRSKERNNVHLPRSINN